MDSGAISPALVLAQGWLQLVLFTGHTTLREANVMTASAKGETPIDKMLGELTSLPLQGLTGGVLVPHTLVVDIVHTLRASAALLRRCEEAEQEIAQQVLAKYQPKKRNDKEDIRS